MTALCVENMFCARCGQQIPDASELCPLCGRQATLELVPQPAPAALAQPQFVLTSALPIAQGPSGVRGWLLFYCIALTILAPLSLTPLYVFYSVLHRYVYILRNIEALLNITRIMYGFVVGIFLWARRPVALALLKIYFIAVAAETLLFTLEAVNQSLRIHSSVFLGSRFSSLMISAGITLLWFIYFRKSVRVKNTYGANL